MKNLLTLSLVIISSNVYAAGAAGGGHISDLMFPAINFFLLFGFIIFKMKKPISDSFTRNSEEVENLYNIAEEKSKEAQIKLDEYTKKLDSLDSETSRILQNAEEDGTKFDNTQKAETFSSIERMKRDAANKIESEKNEMVRELNSSLLDEVITKAKTEINGNNEYKTKATRKLLSDIG
jgi:F-type H+-transporting ATPase subunit b